MKSLPLILFLVSLNTLYVSGQDYQISGSIGVSAMKLDELHSYQEELMAKTLVPVKGFSYFPPYTYMRLSLENAFSEDFRAGFTFGHASTGAHANYRDYSGYMNLNQVVNNYHFGFTGYYKLYSKGALVLSAMGNLSLNYTRNRVNEYIITTMTSLENRLDFRAYSPSLLAGIEMLYDLGAVLLGIETGYKFSSAPEMIPVERENFNPASLEPSGSLKANLSGIRAGLKIVLPLSAPEQESSPVQIL